MNDYPDAVNKIVEDYMERLRLQLRTVPVRDQSDFLREIQSHIFESYQQETTTDDIAKILNVLRNLGEPADVVAERLPDSIVRTGREKNLPLYVVGGILLVLFGVPLGFGAVAVLVGVLAAVAGIVIGYYALAGGVLLVGVIGMILGVVRMNLPGLWDNMVTAGFIQINGPIGEFLDVLSPASQGMLLITFFAMFAAAGLGLLWLGKHLFRGLRFLFNLFLEWTGQMARSLRGMMGHEKIRRIHQYGWRGFHAIHNRD